MRGSSLNCAARFARPVRHGFSRIGQGRCCRRIQATEPPGRLSAVATSRCCARRASVALRTPQFSRAELIAVRFILTLPRAAYPLGPSRISKLGDLLKQIGFPFTACDDHRASCRSNTFQSFGALRNLPCADAAIVTLGQAGRIRSLEIPNSLGQTPGSALDTRGAYPPISASGPTETFRTLAVGG